jgi:hypothetical protein
LILMVSLNVTVFLMVSKRDFFSTNYALLRSTAVGEIVTFFQYPLIESYLAFPLEVKPSTTL